MSFEDNFGRLSHRNLVPVNPSKIAAALPGDVGENADVLEVREDPPKKVLVVTSLGIRQLTKRFRGYDLTDTADFGEISSVREDDMHFRSGIVFGILVTRHDGSSFTFSPGSASIRHDYYGVPDTSQFNGPLAIRDALFAAIGAGIQTYEHSINHVPIQPPATTTATEDAALQIMKTIARNGGAGTIGELVMHDRDLALAMRTVINHTSPSPADHVPIALALIELLAKVALAGNVTADDIQAVMGVPDDMPQNHGGSLQAAYGLSSMATSVLGQSPSIGGSDANFLGWQELTDLPTELAAWYAIAVIRVGQAGLGPRID